MKHNPFIFNPSILLSFNPSILQSFNLSIFQSSIFHLPSSIFHLPSSIFLLPSSIFHLPSSISESRCSILLQLIIHKSILIKLLKTVNCQLSTENFLRLPMLQSFHLSIFLSFYLSISQSSNQPQKKKDLLKNINKSSTIFIYSSKFSTYNLQPTTYNLQLFYFAIFTALVSRITVTFT
ncbi:hypothetical protein FLAN108750_01950 [Flavobacterium antarcticum]